MLDAGHWHDGWLRAYRRDRDGWRGFVRWYDGGQAYGGWKHEDELRRP